MSVPTLLDIRCKAKAHAKRARRAARNRRLLFAQTARDAAKATGNPESHERLEEVVRYIMDSHPEGAATS